MSGGNAAADVPAITPKLARLLDRLACPHCHGPLRAEGAGLTCPSCRAVYPIRNGKVYFVEPVHTSDDLDSIKTRLKGMLGSRYYTLFRPLLSPSYPFRFGRYVLRHVDPGREVVVDLGSGNHRYHPDLFALDLVDYANVDLVADVARLPFADAAVDAFTTSSLLEHVADLEGVVAGIRRATAVGGHSIHQVPFLYPYHASPEDYRRLTHRGAAALFPGWRLEAQLATGGPFTLLNVMVVEGLSLLLGLGVPRLKSLAYLCLLPLFVPFKLLDVLFVGRRWLLTLAPMILTHLRRPER